MPCSAESSPCPLWMTILPLDMLANAGQVALRKKSCNARLQILLSEVIIQIIIQLFRRHTGLVGGNRQEP